LAHFSRFFFFSVFLLRKLSRHTFLSHLFTASSRRFRHGFATGCQCFGGIPPEIQTPPFFLFLAPPKAYSPKRPQRYTRHRFVRMPRRTANPPFFDCELLFYPPPSFQCLFSGPLPSLNIVRVSVVFLSLFPPQVLTTRHF